MIDDIIYLGELVIQPNGQYRILGLKSSVQVRCDNTFGRKPIPSA